MGRLHCSCHSALHHIPAFLPCFIAAGSLTLKPHLKKTLVDPRSFKRLRTRVHGWPRVSSGCRPSGLARPMNPVNGRGQHPQPVCLELKRHVNQRVHLAAGNALGAVVRSTSGRMTRLAFGSSHRRMDGPPGFNVSSVPGQNSTRSWYVQGRIEPIYA